MVRLERALNIRSTVLDATYLTLTQPVGSHQN